MTKKTEAPRPDADGYLRTGIYQQYVGVPKEIGSDEFKQAARQSIEHFNTPAAERVDSIRVWLFSILEPHLTGPISKDDAISKPGEHRVLRDGDDTIIYTLKAGLSAEDNATVEAKEVQGALRAMHEVDAIVHQLVAGNTDQVV